MIDIKNLIFSYGQDFTLAVDELNLPDKGFVSLIGPNGSGKTTLLRILAGLLKEHTGEVIVCGKNIKQLSKEEMAEKVAYVPVYVRPDNPVTVRELILSGAYRYGGDADISQVTELCGIEKMLEKSVYSISSGEMKRVLIARALIQKTDIVIMDEPFANLDPNYEIRVMELIREIAKEKLIIAAVHNVTLASVISDRIAGLKEGRLAFYTEKKVDAKILKDLYSSEFITINDHPYPDYFSVR
ncbi:MAG: hypothetical protein C0602_00470 [Denitrovibrio sp.]|nr:MAG: hypothetical protein C0602_00470 [Denitrovibrio sp.]